MKTIDKHYEDWCEKNHTNLCHSIYDSAEATEFAKYYHREMIQTKNISEEKINAYVESHINKGNRRSILYYATKWVINELKYSI